MNMIIFLAGSVGYGFFEIAFRGYTHWTMMLTGGACVLTIYYLNKEYPNAPLLFRTLGGTLVILVFEFFVGLIVNVWFAWDVWDYSNVPGNILGQICPLYCGAWFALSFLLCLVFQWIRSLSIKD